MSLLYKQFTIFGQAYGTTTYGAEQYSCADGETACQTQVVGAPNTGFFTNTDAVLATTAGALLVAVAVVGAIFVLVARVKRKNKTEN